MPARMNDAMLMNDAMKMNDATTLMNDVSDATHDVTLADSDFTPDELAAHLARFKQFDLDDSGFITCAELKAIFEALDMPEVTDAQCGNMIEEVALLTGNANNGKISFRDYVNLMKHEADKTAAAEEAEAKAEEAEESLRVSMREESERDQESGRDDDEEEEHTAAASESEHAPAEVKRPRGSSFAVLQAIAGTRIAKFESIVKEVAPSTTEALRNKKFADRLARFQRAPSGPGALNRESMQQATLKSKLSAFEAASKADPIAFKTSWRNVRQGTWRQKKEMAGGPPPKKSLAELP